MRLVSCYIKKQYWLVLVRFTYSEFVINCFLADFEIDNIDLINMDIESLNEGWANKFDTVIMNPPFGTKQDTPCGNEMLEINSSTFSLKNKMFKCSILLPIFPKKIVMSLLS